MGNTCAPSRRREEGELDTLSELRGKNKSLGERSDTSTVYKSNIGSEDIQSDPPETVTIEEVEESWNQGGENVKKPAQETKSVDKTKATPVVEEKKKQQVVKRVVSAGCEAEYVLRKITVSVTEHFNLLTELGDGQYGTTYNCVEKATGKEYACKSISKQKLVTEEDINFVRREVEIMRQLAENPNVISIKDTYEDAQAVHIIMELCAGGELIDRLVKLGHYTERKAAELVRIIVGVVQSCHSLRIMHRDLKPESFLYINEDDDSPLKTIDFGLSVIYKPGELFTDLVGSPYYVAPEVLQKSYGPEADIWSAGVITYIILSGSPPFRGETQEEIFKEILHSDIDFLSDPWPKVSDSAKDLVKKMLVRDPRKRLTASEVLCHPWVRLNGVAPDTPMDPAVSSRLMQFSHKDKLKRMALRVITENLSEEEIAGLQEMFKMIDTDDSSKITLEELKDGMKRFGANLDELQMKSLMSAVEFDNNGTVDYQGFLGSMLSLHKIEKDDLLQAAFSYLDKDGNGYISRDELQKACKQFGVDAAGLEEIIQEADQNHDGHIDYQEFVAAMQKGHIDLDKRLQNGSNIRNGGATPVC